ncbi:Major Facilitator Superfamily protein [Acanthocheilonema viteae]
MLDREEEVGMQKTNVEGALSNCCATHSQECQLYSTCSSALQLEKKAIKFSSCDKSNTESTCASSEEEPVAPDGGYGWVIVLASFLIHFICDGISFSFGIMFSEIQEYFNVSKTMSGIVGSIFLSMPLLSGPLAGALTDIYDCRRMTIVGGLIAAGGGLISFFAFSIWHFLLSFAFITGIGLSFCFNSAIVAVTYYFQKKRAIATGIAVCGSGAGTFVLAPLIEMLFAKFGWHSSLLCMGFLLLLIVGCGFMIKDLEWPHDTIEYKRKKFIEKTEREKLRLAMWNAGNNSGVFTVDSSYIDSVPRRTVSLPSIPTYAIPFLQVVHQSSNTQSVKTAVNELQIPVPKSYSMAEFLHDPGNDITKQQTLTFDVNSSGQLNLRVHDVEIVASSESSRQTCSEGSCYAETDDLTSNQGSEVDIKFSRKTFSDSGDNSLNDIVGSGQSELIPAKLERAGNCNFVQDATKQPLLDDDIKRGKSATQILKTSDVIISSFANRTTCNSFIMNQLGAAQGRVPATNVLNFRWKFMSLDVGMSRRIPSAPAICYRRKRRSGTIQLNKMWKSFLEWLSNTKMVLIIPEFSIFLLSTFILYVFFDIPYVNFPEYAVEVHNITETKASYLVSSIGLTNMVSMLFCGIVADWSRTSGYVIQMYGIFITLAGLCVALTPFATSYIHLMALCIGFGFFISANYTLASVITLQILCLYDFQTGYGILCLVEGLGNLLGPALIGFIRDNLTGYDNIFLLAGGGVVISGLMVVAIDIFMRTCDIDHEKKHSIKRER